MAGLHLNIDSSVFTGLTKLANIAIINVLFIVCSIPIFTIGASFTAMMDVAWKMTRGREGTSITREFFRAFKTNFKKSTLIWLIQLVFIVILVVDYRIIRSKPSMVFYVVFAIMTILVAFTSWYSLTLTAIFENSVIQTIKNAILMSLGRFPWSLLIAACFCSPLVLLFLPARRAFFFIPFILILWIGAAAYGAASIFRKALKPFLPKDYDEIPDDIPDEPDKTE